MKPLYQGLFYMSMGYISGGPALTCFERPVPGAAPKAEAS
jgi:hypothetical protein